MAENIFFSYAHEDREWVAYVAARVGHARFNPFFDRDIIGGQQWWDRLLSEIEQCDVFIPVLSPAYLRSTPCRIEVSYAVELGKPLIPLDLCAGTLSGAAFIEPIKAAQWVPYNPADPPTTVLDLVGALNNAPVAPPLPEGRQRPTAPGADVMSTAVRLVGSVDPLTETEQWAVVGELRANMRGENRAAAQALLASLLGRHDLLASVHEDASAMYDEPAVRSQPAGRRGDAATHRPAAAPAAPRPPVDRNMPRTHMVWSIITTALGATFLLGAVPGAIALVSSSKVQSLWRKGEEEAAREASQRARTWNLIGLVVLVLVVIAVVVNLANQAPSCSNNPSSSLPSC